jgi:tRNA pseudouridine13 synthase
MSTSAACQDRGLFPGYLTADLPGTGGILRHTAADFYVQELPLYPPTGQGQHVLFEIEKRDMTTRQAVQRIASALGLRADRLGSAGLKDAHAVARQWLSVEGTTPERVRALDLAGIEILSADWHRNRLKIGHLSGNHFRIRIRALTCPDPLARADAILQVLSERGLPNNFGPQRFGLRQNTHRLGECLLRHDTQDFLAEFLGLPQPADSEAIQAARAAFDAGDLATALSRWPSRNDQEYVVLRGLAEGQPPARALSSIPKSLRQLFLAAYQSYLFNQLLAARLNALDHLIDGDLAIKHNNGAFFLVTDAAAEQPRANHLEISASAPLFGYKVRLAEGEVGEAERAMLAAQGLALEGWRVGAGTSMEGQRRPLRVPLSNVDASLDPEGLVLAFDLPPGSYATDLIGEITKGPL